MRCRHRTSQNRQANRKANRQAVAGVALLRRRAERPGLQLLYDSTVPDGHHPIFSPEGHKMAPQPGHYVKNVKSELATLCSLPAGTPHMMWLAMLRSFGDFPLHPYGLTHAPSIVEAEGAGRLALFSDGITDVFTDEDLAALAGEPGSLQEVADRLLAEATKKAEDLFGETMDDRTVVLAEG